MAVVLLVPLILVVFHLAVLVERERDQTVDNLALEDEFRRVLLLQLEDDFSFTARAGRGRVRGGGVG